MGLLRLCVCVSGVYAAFLLWAIAQERLSQPFQAQPPHPHTPPPHTGEKFPSPLFFNFSQALASASAAATYLLFHGWRSGELRANGVASVLGLNRLFASTGASIKQPGRGSAEQPKVGSNKSNGSATIKGQNGNGNGAAAPPRPWYQSLPALLLQVSLFQTTAGPIGFHALKHISYPTMVLAKSCKLIPVLLLNVLLYRRRFGSHKYAVVTLVSAGISMFMLFGSKKKGGGGDSVFGMTLLLINLLIDGLTNSTQDQIFALYPGYSGQQMMFIMAFLQLCLLTPAMLLPLPANPLGQVAALLSPGTDRTAAAAASQLLSSFSSPILLQSLHFLMTHPSAVSPLAAYAALGGLGQIFIFETIAHFGSLTLVMVTVTRKLFTMLLSVFVFGHKLTPGQWAGVAVVFAGIGLEAGFKRREARRRVQRDNKTQKTE